ncbi:hypothetical protein PRIPAC_80352 [Pristionchus pacificus]|uniref:Uncharacterized protein n=1 Tax=Pristionchus pacificus TaxID=54126 RepID=A0A2A6CJL7_PRIPA|nr:hypothetical protein PRIPAC_80352 [Pristionchus pacificus]|eukprot:PDM78211.1 hypothetical protein PRIPAC_30790 [Pristionchus pacificus]
MAVVISSKTHEDVREESTEFMKGVDVSELEGLETALLIKARALSHLLIIVHENGTKKGQSEDEFQEKCASDIASVLGVNLQSAAMSVLSVACLCLMTTVVAAQNIIYDSVFCGAVGLPHSSAETKDKYKILVTNLNKDRTLNAQKNRVVNFIINNWTNLKGIGEKAAVIDFIQGASAMLEKRWRIVAYLKGLLAKMKSKFDSAKVENSPIINKENVIADVVIAWETRNASSAFDNEFYDWRQSSESLECFK